MFCREKRSVRRSFMKIDVADDGTSATLVLKTENAKEGGSALAYDRLGREKGGEWKITHWHTSR